MPFIKFERQIFSFKKRKEVNTTKSCMYNKVKGLIKEEVWERERERERERDVKQKGKNMKFSFCDKKCDASMKFHRFFSLSCAKNEKSIVGIKMCPLNSGVS